MKKVLLFSTLIALLFVTKVYGKAQKYEHLTGTSTTSDSGKTKFGVHVHSSIFGSKVGGFVEYEMHEAIGLQTGLLFFNDAYTMESLKEDSNISAIVKPSHVSVPLIARFYSGKKRQFCMFAGLQVNYLRGGNIVYPGKYTRGESVKYMLPLSPTESGLDSEDMYEIKEIKDKSAQRVTVSNWGSHLLVGFDYEYLGGFQLGLEYGLGLSSIAKCEETIFNWTLKPTLGYNFAKLFN
jgi:hypothetical protein